MITYLTALLPFIGPMFLFIFFSYGPKLPVTPAVDEVQIAAEKANKDLIAETGASTSGSTSADVIISNADAGKLAVADGAEGLLKNCRVMFVLA